MTVEPPVVNICSSGTIKKQLMHVYPSGMGAVTVTGTVLVQKRNAFRPAASKVSNCTDSVGES